MSSIVQIKDSAYDGLQSLRVYGNTVQNLWVNPSGTMGGVTVTANENGTVSISGDFDGTTVNAISDYIYTLKPSTQYVLSINKSVINSNGGYFALQQFDTDGTLISGSSKYVGYGNTLSTTFTTDASISKCRCIFYANSNAVITNGTYRVMLNEGSTAKPWCPPGLNSVGDGGSVEIVTAGKNLFDYAKQSGRYFTAGTLSAGTYTMSLDSLGDWWTENEGNDRAIFWYMYNSLAAAAAAAAAAVASKGGLIGYTDSGAATFAGANIGVRSSAIFTTDTSGCILFIAYYGPTWINQVANIQLELGSTATAYEPPNITTTPIDLQGHTLNALPDGTRDELHIDGGGNVVLEKRTWSDVFDGTEPWIDSINRYGLDNGLAFAATVGIVARDTMMADTLPIIDDFVGSSGIKAYSGRWVDASIKTMLGDVAGFKAWLGNNNTTLIYKLAEPQTIDLGTVELPKLRKNKVNTIFADARADTTGFSLAPDIEVDYYRWKPCSDGFKADGKHTSRDFGMCIASRDTGTPEKKSITATVPYMSGFYDFSALYGSPAYESREVTYTFEFLEDSTEALQEKKSAVLDWLTKIQDVPIYDDDLEWKHFVGSYSVSEFEENEDGISGTLEVTFLCQPFIESDRDTTATLNAGARTVTVKGQPVNAYAKTSSGTATIQIGGVTQSVGTTEIRLSVQLQPGDNAVTVTGSPVVLRWKELTA